MQSGPRSLRAGRVPDRGAFPRRPTRPSTGVGRRWVGVNGGKAPEGNGHPCN